jgi:hypothetical protein
VRRVFFGIELGLIIGVVVFASIRIVDPAAAGSLKCRNFVSRTPGGTSRGQVCITHFPSWENLVLAAMLLGAIGLALVILALAMTQVLRQHSRV